MRRNSRKSLNIRWRSPAPRSPRTSRNVSSPLPTPYHPGTQWRFFVPADTHGRGPRGARGRAPERRPGRGPRVRRPSSPRRLGGVRAAGGARAPTHRSAATVEKRDRHAALRPEPREPVLSLRELPVRREEASILVRVGVAAHVLVYAALRPDAASDQGHLEQV